MGCPALIQHPIAQASVNLTMPSSGVAPGTPGTLGSSRCSMNTGQGVSHDRWKRHPGQCSDEFPTGHVRGLEKVYANAFDSNGLLTHWVQGATITVQ